MDLEFKKINLVKVDNIGIITFNCPAIQNVLCYDTFRELDYALKFFESDKKIRVILLKSTCSYSKNNIKIFSAGVNLKEYDKKFQLIEENPAEFEKLLKQARSVLTNIETLKKPVIAAVDGFAIGGAFEIVLACDLVLVSETAQFSLKEINIGLIPGYGGMQRLLKSVGKNKAFEIMATGKTLSAQETVDIGIAVELYADSDFNKKSMEYCKKLSQKSPNSLYLIKDSIHQLTTRANYEEIEVKNFIKAAKSGDAREGITAFTEKRSPDFIQL